MATIVEFDYSEAQPPHHDRSYEVITAEQIRQVGDAWLQLTGLDGVRTCVIGVFTVICTLRNTDGTVLSFYCQDRDGNHYFGYVHRESFTVIKSRR